MVGFFYLYTPGMKQQTSAVRVLSIVAILALLFGSCATTASVTTAEPLTITLVDKAAIKSAYGVRFATNPYLEPYGLFTGQKNEFVVVEARFNLPDPHVVLFDAAVYGPDETVLATLYDRAAMHRFWADWEGLANPETRKSAIDNACMPAARYAVPKGKRRYFLVCVGLNPLPRPASVRGSVVFDDGRRVDFDFPIASLPPTK